MNVKDTYLIFFHTGKSQFVMDLQRYKNKWVKETRLKRYGNLRHCEPRETQSFHDPTLGDVGEAESESQYVNSGWREGRRVVELCILAENLAQCSAEGCDLLQDLRNTVSEYSSVNKKRCSTVFTNFCIVYTGPCNANDTGFLLS